MGPPDAVEKVAPRDGPHSLLGRIGEERRVLIGQPQLAGIALGTGSGRCPYSGKALLLESIEIGRASCRERV